MAALVNDWGHAKFIKDIEQGLYYGEFGLQDASLKVLESLSAAGEDCWQNVVVEFKPADDLGSVVCMVFRQVCTAVYDGVREQKDPQALLHFWKRELRPPIWQRMVNAAQDCNYDRLKSAIQEVLCQMEEREQIEMEEEEEEEEEEVMDLEEEEPQEEREAKEDVQRARLKKGKPVEYVSTLKYEATSESHLYSMIGI